MDCNNCICSDGQWGCTRMNCESDRNSSTAHQPQCTSGEIKKMDCNNCHCVNGQWGCTKMICVRQAKKSKGKRNYKKAGKETGKKKAKVYSSKDYSVDSGKGSYSSKEETECSSGEEKKMGCATCSCSDMGKWLCTGACDPGIENKWNMLYY